MISSGLNNIRNKDNQRFWFENLEMKYQNTTDC